MEIKRAHAERLDNNSDQQRDSPMVTRAVPPHRLPQRAASTAARTSLTSAAGSGAGLVGTLVVLGVARGGVVSRLQGAVDGMLSVDEREHQVHGTHCA